MNDLKLPLKKKWFDMTKAGVKPEEYRELTAYWAARLLLYNGKKEKESFWDMMPIKLCESTFKYHPNITPISVDNNIMTLGYPKADDTDRIVILEHKGIQIAMGNPEWGADPGKYYFVIKHGIIIN